MSECVATFAGEAWRGYGRETKWMISVCWFFQFIHVWVKYALKHIGAGTQACFSDWVDINRFCGVLHRNRPADYTTFPALSFATKLHRNCFATPSSATWGSSEHSGYCLSLILLHELNSQWLCKEKKCLHLTAVTIKPTDRRGAFDP